MPKTEAQKRAQEIYMGKFKRVGLRMDPAIFDQIKDHADKMGDNSINAFAIRAMTETMRKERKEMGWE